MYLTLQQLADKPGSTELGQVAVAEHSAPVEPALMEATLRAADRSGWSAEEIAAADDAKARIEGAIEESSATIDAYLARRVSIPRDPVPTVLVRIARAIVRYELHRHLLGGEDSRTHPVLRDYREAIKLLEAIRDGKVTLGADDPAAAGNGLGDVRIHPGSKVFGRDAMRRYP